MGKLRVRYKGADYIIESLSKEDQEMMRVEIGHAIKMDQERKKLLESKKPKKKVEK